MADQPTPGTTDGRNGSEFRRGQHSFHSGIKHDTDPQPSYNRNRGFNHSKRDNSSTGAFQPYPNHNPGSVPLKFRRENSESSRLWSQQENGRMSMPLGPSPRVHSDRRASENLYCWERRQGEAQSESRNAGSEPGGAQSAVDLHGKLRADRQFQLLSEDMRLVKEDVERHFPACLEPDAMDTSWGSGQTFLCA
jgi:hypothetical protein